MLQRSLNYFLETMGPQKNPVMSDVHLSLFLFSHFFHLSLSLFFHLALSFFFFPLSSRVSLFFHRAPLSSQCTVCFLLLCVVVGLRVLLWW